MNAEARMTNDVKTRHEFWGAHAPSRAGDGALAVADFSAQLLEFVTQHFGEGAEMDTRGACAPQTRERST
jgi:hypothetical protein